MRCPTSPEEEARFESPAIYQTCCTTLWPGKEAIGLCGVVPRSPPYAACESRPGQLHWDWRWPTGELVLPGHVTTMELVFADDSAELAASEQDKVEEAARSLLESGRGTLEVTVSVNPRRVADLDAAKKLARRRAEVIVELLRKAGLSDESLLSSANGLSNYPVPVCATLKYYDPAPPPRPKPEHGPTCTPGAIVVAELQPVSDVYEPPPSAQRVAGGAYLHPVWTRLPARVRLEACRNGVCSEARLDMASLLDLPPTRFAARLRGKLDATVHWSSSHDSSVLPNWRIEISGVGQKLVDGEEYVVNVYSPAGKLLLTGKAPGEYVTRRVTDAWGRRDECQGAELWLLLSKPSERTDTEPAPDR